MSDKKAYSLECCWACHKIMMVPLTKISVRLLGIPKIHKQCAEPGIFIRLGVEAIALVTARSLEEVVKPHNQGRPTADARQPELFDDA